MGLEVGPRRRVFAQAIGWPGWCRGARDEERAIAALLAYTERYRAAIGPTLAAPLGSDLPLGTDLPLGSDPLPVRVTERVEGDATTDFGAPGRVLASDRVPLATGDPERLASFLEACWSAFDTARAATPAGIRPTKPEVGRSPDGIRLHVLGAQRAYLAWLVKPAPKLDESRLDASEQAIRAAFARAVRALPAGVPFEAERHPGAYAVRRECWHVLDHAWELQDRLLTA